MCLRSRRLIFCFLFLLRLHPLLPSEWQKHRKSGFALPVRMLAPLSVLWANWEGLLLVLFEGLVECSSEELLFSATLRVHTFNTIMFIYRSFYHSCSPPLFFPFFSFLFLFFETGFYVAQDVVKFAMYQRLAWNPRSSARLSSTGLQMHAPFLDFFFFTFLSGGFKMIFTVSKHFTIIYHFLPIITLGGSFWKIVSCTGVE